MWIKWYTFEYFIKVNKIFKCISFDLLLQKLFAGWSVTKFTMWASQYYLITINKSSIKWYAFDYFILLIKEHEK